MKKKPFPDIEITGKESDEEVRVLWNRFSQEVRDNRNELGDNRIQFHMHTLVIDCLRYSDPKDVRGSQEVLQQAQELIRNKKATRDDYMELRELLRGAGFESLPEMEG